MHTWLVYVLPVPTGKFWGLHRFMTLLGGRLSKEGGTSREGRGPCHSSRSPQDESFLVQLLLSPCFLFSVLIQGYSAPLSMALALTPSLKPASPFSVFLVLTVMKMGLQKGKQWRREAFYSPGLLPLAFRLCPVRARMTDRLRL